MFAGGPGVGQAAGVAGWRVQIRAGYGHEELDGGHAAYYAAFAERAALGLRGADEAAWARGIDADFDNIRVAVRWALDHKETDLALRLVTALWTYPHD